MNPPTRADTLSQAQDLCKIISTTSGASMHFLTEYGMFLAKVVTSVIAILIVIGGIVAIATKNKLQDKLSGKLTIKKLNEQYDELTQAVNDVTLSKEQRKADKKAKKAEKKKHKNDKEPEHKRLFVINFSGDIKASAVKALREEITAILLTKRDNDEVLLRLESPGGMVHGYGLAASQLQRLRDANIKLTIAVDKMAASGGYMMACVADHIIAAPFSIVGSIGVVTQLPNFHRLLKKHNVDFEQQTAGEYKRTLTMFGENTDSDREKVQEEIEDAHQLFKTFIRRHRPQVDLEKAATGEHWFSAHAIDFNLIDQLQTSDDFLLKAKNHYDVFEINYETKKSLSKRLAAQASATLHSVFTPKRSGGSDYI